MEQFKTKNREISNQNIYICMWIEPVLNFCRQVELVCLKYNTMYFVRYEQTCKLFSYFQSRLKSGCVDGRVNMNKNGMKLNIFNK